MKDDPHRTEEFKRENRMAQVEKLRINWDAMGEIANIERYLAAGTIQDLMDEVEAWQNAMRKAERDIAQLRAERDEARRELCYWWELSKRQRKLKNGHKFTPTHVEWAQIVGWDCFKEDA